MRWSDICLKERNTRLVVLANCLATRLVRIRHLMCDGCLLLLSPSFECVMLTCFSNCLADILHSCLGLAALAAMRHQDLKSIDPAICISISAMDMLPSVDVSAFLGADSI